MSSMSTVSSEMKVKIRCSWTQCMLLLYKSDSLCISVLTIDPLVQFACRQCLLSMTHYV